MRDIACIYYATLNSTFLRGRNAIEANRKVFKYKTVIVQLRENSAASPTANRGDEKDDEHKTEREKKPFFFHCFIVWKTCFCFCKGSEAFSFN